MNAREAAEAGHFRYRKTKIAAVLEAGRKPTDAAPLLESHAGENVRVALVPRAQLRTFCESLARTNPDLLIYNSDAIRRKFDVSTPEGRAEVQAQRHGDQLRAHAEGDPRAQEVLSTLAVTADGELAAAISAYVYEDGVPVFAAEEFDTLLDSTVVEDLRKAFG